MRQVPYVQNKGKGQIVRLGGINYSNVLQDGDLADCKNISASKFPYITTAKEAQKMQGTGYENAEAITSYQNLISFADDKMYLDGHEHIDLPTSEKQTAIVNGKMMVLPDEELAALKSGYTVTSGDTSNVSDINRLYAWFNLNGIYAAGTHNFYRWGGEATVQEINAIRYTSPATPYVLYKVTTSGRILYSREQREFSVLAGEFVAVEWTYQNGNIYWLDNPVIVTVSEGLELPQESGGFVYLSDPENILNGYIEDTEIVGICDTALLMLSAEEPQKHKMSSISAKCIYSSQYGYRFNKNLADFLSVNDIIEIIQGDTYQKGKITNISNDTMTAATVSGESEISFAVGKWYCFKKFEGADFCCEWNNRLWCVSSGKQLIYASVQGKPDDFLSEMGLSTGAYQVTIGDIEPFTGMTKFESSILFFKQNKIYKILGSSPKNYELFSYEMEGVKMGCHKSICTIGGILYYVGLHGVYAYSGGSPVLISSNLGNMEMKNAVGGTDGERYFLSFESNGADYFFTYEPKYNIWIKNESIKIADFARKGEETYYLNGKEKTVYKMNAGDTPDSMEWYAQFTPFYETIEGKKRYSKLIIRAEVSKKAYISAKIRADGGIWTEVGIMKGNTQNTQTMRIPITRCDKFELRLEGQGKCTIHEILREFDLGSDVL